MFDMLVKKTKLCGRGYNVFGVFNSCERIELNNVYTLTFVSQKAKKVAATSEKVCVLYVIYGCVLAMRVRITSLLSIVSPTTGLYIFRMISKESINIMKVVKVFV